ncbi:LysR substrate-binding domain-containing protein [Pseudoprimorskyibacter insulae]|uniref:HTH-type transcriptional regulator PerR n=1 Tax=Pseudoprimorskyibacter insulae TaxID=1695997 RepID=A0A2R8ANG6_9RHOB|nr:LysR substrate-binding domain-containing protein [Pseudoprimorskyibacter insulae]SPF77586.1 HTH-type transcriptional regulator PerR [Pseudoprimorskyibacter insulae]
MARDANLNAYQFFEAVARRGTITLAAEELGVSPSAVSQQIKALEQQLGIRLFRREGRMLTLTMEGEQLFQASATALRLLREARRNLGKSREARRLALRVSPSFGVRWLGPRLSGFLAQNPDWDLRVDAAPDPTNFDREIMDMDVRYGFGGWAGLHCAPLLHDYVVPLCSPDYLAGLPTTETATERLASARLIDSARALCQWDFWLWRAGLETRSNRKGILMDRSSMALQLAADGVGVVLESLTLAAPEIKNGRLVPFLPAYPVLSFPAYWLVCPHRHLSRRTVKLFLNWIDSEIDTFRKDINTIIQDHGLRCEDVDAAQEMIRGGSRG